MPPTRFEECWALPTVSLPELIIPHRLPVFLKSLMPLKNWCSIHARCFKSSLKHFIRFCGIFQSLKHNFIAYRSSKVSLRPDCIFEIHQLWQPGFSRVYSNCCCSCSFGPEIIKIGQSSYKMHSNNIVNFQESTTILNACTKKSGNLLKAQRMYKKHLALNNLRWSICHKTKPNQTKPNHRYSMYMYEKHWALNNLQRLICHKTLPNQIKYI